MDWLTNIEWSELLFNGAMVAIAFVLMETVFWFFNTVLFKTIFGEAKVAPFVEKLRKGGYRLAFISLLLGFDFDYMHDVVNEELPAFQWDVQWIHLSALFFVAANLIFLFGKWYKAVELRRL